MTDLLGGFKALNITIDKSTIEEFVHIDDKNNKVFSKEILDDVNEMLEIIQATNYNSKDRGRLVRHSNSIWASTNQDQGQGFTLLSPRAAGLPRLDAGTGGVEPTSSCIVQNMQT